MPDDQLSALLQSVKLTGAVFLNAEFRAPWCVSADGALLRQRMPAVEHFVNYHFIAEGACDVAVGGLPPCRVAAGDLVVFPHGDAHVMASSLQLAATPMEGLVAPGDGAALPVLRHGGHGDATRVICGFLACDPRLCRPILSALPRRLVVALRGDPEGDWIEQSLRHSVVAAASGEAGAAAVLARLSEALFVEALRRYAAARPPGDSGWLAGLRDPLVGRALVLIHQQPARHWTVDDLAREVGCSRTVLAQRFSHCVGEPPMKYLARWRLAMAAHALRLAPAGTLARVAQDVGYDSEAAFNRAFKRELGVTPARWRRRA
ncbi:MAG: AraC family transcriptional regulator [Burkholderiaceae bacterium]